MTEGTDFVVPETKGVPVPVPEAVEKPRVQTGGRRDVGPHVVRMVPSKRVRAAYRKTGRKTSLKKWVKEQVRKGAEWPGLQEWVRNKTRPSAA